MCEHTGGGRGGRGVHESASIQLMLTKHDLHHKLHSRYLHTASFLILEMKISTMEACGNIKLWFFCVQLWIISSIDYVWPYRLRKHILFHNARGWCMNIGLHWPIEELYDKLTGINTRQKAPDNYCQKIMRTKHLSSQLHKLRSDMNLKNWQNMLRSKDLSAFFLARLALNIVKHTKREYSPQQSKWWKVHFFSIQFHCENQNHSSS